MFGWNRHYRQLNFVNFILLLSVFILNSNLCPPPPRGTPFHIRLQCMVSSKYGFALRTAQRWHILFFLGHYLSLQGIYLHLNPSWFDPRNIKDKGFDPETVLNFFPNI